MKYHYSLIRLILFVATVVLLGSAFATAQGVIAVSFVPSLLQGTCPVGNTDFCLKNPTSLQFGPDNRLYVSQRDGRIYIYTIQAVGDFQYKVTTISYTDAVWNILNHNDDGKPQPNLKGRTVTGLLVTGTGEKPVLWVTSSDQRSNTIPLIHSDPIDTNSGVISRLTWQGIDRDDPQGRWELVNIVRGLPRSRELHTTNGLVLDESNHRLLVVQAGNTNMGAPSLAFGYLPEFALSAAILSVDLSKLETLETNIRNQNGGKLPTDIIGQQYLYDLPTLNLQTSDLNNNDPFGGNGGLNMSVIDPTGPIQIFAAGVRNSYDLAIYGENVFFFDNDYNVGYGDPPNGNSNNTNGDCNNNITSLGSREGIGDQLHFTPVEYVGARFYGGHPNPTRANPHANLFLNDNEYRFNTGWDGSNIPIDLFQPVPDFFHNPIECDYRFPPGDPSADNDGGPRDGSLISMADSMNGIAIYKASKFQRAIQGNLIVTGFASHRLYRFAIAYNMNNSPIVVDENHILASETLGAQGLLDVTTQGDSEIFPGTIWAAAFNSNNIVSYQPLDIADCTGVNDASLDEDMDHYNNHIELSYDPPSDPCSAASIPPDHDQDFVPDRNDVDDDNDGIGDIADAFALDSQNGLTTQLPILYEMSTDFPGTGLLNLGFTGLMINNSEDYLDQYDRNNILAGTAASLLSISQIGVEDSFENVNSQQNGFQFGININIHSNPLIISSRLISPYFASSNGNVPKGSQSWGIQIGDGSQDNYLKSTFYANNGNPGIQILLEKNGQVASPATDMNRVYPVPNILNSQLVELRLIVNPATQLVQPDLVLDNNTPIKLGTPFSIPVEWLDANDNKGLAVGIISTSRTFVIGLPTYISYPFTAKWDFIHVKYLPPVSANDAPIINYWANNTFTLKWSRITWASGYHIQLDNNRNFSSPEYENAELNSDNLELTISGIEDNTYYWRIRARYANSSWGQWSSPVSFVLDAGHNYGN